MPKPCFPIVPPNHAQGNECFRICYTAEIPLSRPPPAFGSRACPDRSAFRLTGNGQRALSLCFVA